MKQLSSPLKCPHLTQPKRIRVGKRHIWLTSISLAPIAELWRFDVLVDLANDAPAELYKHGWQGSIMAVPIPDGGSLSNRRSFEMLLRRVWRLMRTKKVVVGCAGGHGRTGCFVAGLIALFEPQTAEPVRELRQRAGCQYMVECAEQGEAVYQLRGKVLPDPVYLDILRHDPTLHPPKLEGVEQRETFNEAWDMVYQPGKGYTLVPKKESDDE